MKYHISSNTRIRYVIRKSLLLKEGGKCYSGIVRLVANPNALLNNSILTRGIIMLSENQQKILHQIQPIHYYVENVRWKKGVKRNV